MKTALKYLLLFLLFTTCRKKTDINVTVYNYALGEPIANANVVIIERKTGGSIFSANYHCKEIAKATTDNNGKCVFDKEKLKTQKSYDYFAVVNYAYGQSQSYPCGGKSSGYLNIGKTNEQVLNYSEFDAYFKVQYNSILNPSQADDSLYVYITSPKYKAPEDPYYQGGGIH